MMSMWLEEQVSYKWRCSIGKQMFGMDKHTEGQGREHIFVERGEREREHEQTSDSAVVLQMDVVDKEEAWRKKSTKESGGAHKRIADANGGAKGERARHKEHFGSKDGGAKEIDGGFGQRIAEAGEFGTEIGDAVTAGAGGESDGGDGGKETLEEGEERRVIQRVLCRLVCVPLAEMLAARERLPVRMHARVGAHVSREQKQLHTERSADRQRLRLLQRHAQPLTVARNPPLSLTPFPRILCFRTHASSSLVRVDLLQQLLQLLLATEARVAISIRLLQRWNERNRLSNVVWTK